MKKILCLTLLATLFLSGCADYKAYYRLDTNYLARRQLETRRFDTKDEDQILTASAQVLQDLGFTIDESETKLGLITATKEQTAGTAAEKVGAGLLALFSGVPQTFDVSQKIFVTLVSTKSHDKKGYNVRVKFARLITDSDNNTRVEKIRDDNIYQNFFDKLSQSLFLTANNI